MLLLLRHFAVVATNGKPPLKLLVGLSKVKAINKTRGLALLLLGFVHSFVDFIGQPIKMLVQSVEHLAFGPVGS